MQFHAPNNHNFVYKAPAGTEDQVGDLPVRVAEDPLMGRNITSAWKPSEEELAQLVAGGSVALVVYGNVQPVVYVGVEGAPSPDKTYSIEFHDSRDRHRIVCSDGRKTEWVGYRCYTYMDGRVGCSAYYMGKEGIYSADEFLRETGCIKLSE